MGIFHILYEHPQLQENVGKKEKEGKMRKFTEFVKWPKPTPCCRKHTELHWFTDKNVMCKLISSPLLQEGQKLHQQAHFRKANIQQHIEKSPLRLVLIQPDMMLRWETNVTGVLDPNSPQLQSSRPGESWQNSLGRASVQPTGFWAPLKWAFPLIHTGGIKSSLGQVPAWNVNNLLQPLYKVANGIVL